MVGANRVTLYMELFIYIYIYIYVCVCVCVKLPPRNLNPNPFPLHPTSTYTCGPTSTYTCGATIALRVRGGYMEFLFRKQNFSEIFLILPSMQGKICFFLH